jgi:hypothetical protein
MTRTITLRIVVLYFVVNENIKKSSVYNVKNLQRTWKMHFIKFWLQFLHSSALSVPLLGLGWKMAPVFMFIGC